MSFMAPAECERPEVNVPDAIVDFFQAHILPGELQGYVAAQANRSKDGKLLKKLYHVYDYLQTFLDTYDDRADLLRRTGVCEGD